ncbi:ankyrin repeat domain-containing protein [uncultured Maribacter sp.]|uniref:ankyrin repeat domain-containing protein n=1 Tax=uncultured Maribacter sp. TaxID=431308 RepID=UPI00261D006A|nr:ankyrin repeat domain-containing protein [uncultured Maribacter sp.]
MKKTVVSIAVASMLMCTGLMANQESANLNLTDSHFVVKSDISTFCKAIIKGDVSLVKGMIEAGENINKKSLGMTPAIFAARYNKAEILELLIKEGADLKIKSNNGLSIKEVAKAANAKDVLTLLSKR